MINISFVLRSVPLSCRTWDFYENVVIYNYNSSSVGQLAMLLVALYRCYVKCHPHAAFHIKNLYIIDNIT